MNDEQRPAPLHIFGAANPEQNEQLARDAQAIVDADVAALPKDCSGTPASCPDNEGHGCACSPAATAPQVVADERATALLASATALAHKWNADAVKGGFAGSEAGMELLEALDWPDAAPVQAQEPVALPGGVLATTIELARCIWRDNYKNEAPDWEPLPDLAGVLSQIDNMVCGMRRAAPVQPVAVPDGALREVVGKVIKAMESSAAPIDLAHALGEVSSQGGRIDFGADLMAELLAAYSAAPAAQGDAKDAERWREALQYVGADRSPALGCSYFVLRGIHSIPGTDLMRGGVAGHFTDSIDAAIAAKAAS